MSLFNDEDGAPSQPLPNFNPNPTAYKDISVDTQYTPVGTILTAIEGKRWVVTWYSQILNRDNQLSTLQSSRLEINQQYKRIRNLELKVTQPLPVNPEFRPESQEFTVRGEANMYPGVRPNLGDLFVATLLDGRVGVFQVSEMPVQLTIYLQTTYRIEYVLREFLTADLQGQLDKKTVKEYQFIQSFLDSGINPVISDEAHAVYQKLMTWQDDVPRYYLTRFFNKEYGTLTLPGQGTATIYDPFITVFIAALWSNANLGPFHGMQFLNVMDGTTRNIQTVLDALLDYDQYLMDVVTTQIPVVSANAFLQDPFLYGASYMGVPYVRWPKFNPDNYTLQFPEQKNKIFNLRNGYRTRPQVRYTVDQLFPTLALDPYAQGWSIGIKDTSIDEYYIFSEDFYSRRPENLSALESLVWQTLTTQQIEAGALLALFNDARNWDDLNQFYYYPIICALIPAALRGLSG